MLLEVRGNFALETKMTGDWEGRADEPGPSGLLVWKDVLNYLRLERTGDHFAALCSTDGSHWMTCDQVVLPVKDPLWVGVAALHGMVVHFGSVRVLGRG
jgi:hypothetical protein